MKKKAVPPPLALNYIDVPVSLNPAQARAAFGRAKQLGLTLEEFIVYAAIRYMDDRTPFPIDQQFSGSNHS